MRLVDVMIYRPFGQVHRIMGHLTECEEERVRMELKGKILIEALNGDASHAIIVSVPSNMH